MEDERKNENRSDEVEKGNDSEIIAEEQAEDSEKPADDSGSEEATKTEPMKEKGKKAPEQEFDISDLMPENIEQVIQFSILQMREWAYIYMGLIPHPKFKKVTTDMKQAKIAIDTATALFEIVQEHLDDKLRREFKIMVSDLKMNFISRSNA